MSSNLSRLAFTFAAAVLLTLGLAAPEAAARPVVSQGDEVIIDRGNNTKASCTVSYVDRKLRLAMTAAHCVTLPGLPVMAPGGPRVGTVLTPAIDASPGQNDFAYILLDAADPGANRFSGDHSLHPSQVRPGERICHYGATTRRTVCGTVHAVRGGAVFATGMPRTDHGDSGGPSWIPGRGFVGPHSGRTAAGYAMFSTPFIYVGPDLFWFWATDLRLPVAPGNLIVDPQIAELSSALPPQVRRLLP